MPSINVKNPRDWFRVLPSFAKLLWRAGRDDRLGLVPRVGLGAIGFYLVMPIDIVPDVIPFAGQVDDLLVLTFGMRAVLKRIPDEILVEHWDGDPAVLSQLAGRELSA